MTYEAFINQVRARLTPLPPEERQAMADYYGELFEDYIENGLSEDEAAVSLLAALDETLRKDYGFTAAADQETKKETASDSRNDRFFPTADITRIEIEDTAHDVLLLPGRGDCLELQYDEEDAQNYVVEQKGSVLHIYFQPKKEESRNFSFRFFHMSLSSDEPLRLFFPSNGFRPEINIKTLSGDIQTSVPLGAANLFTMSGDILFRGEAESLRVSSTSGDVRFEGQAQSLEFKTTSGDIRLIGSAAIPTCFIRSTSGDLHLQHMQSEELDISTVSGNIYFTQCDAAAFSIKSVSGDIQGFFLQPHTFSATSTSGDVSVPPSDPSGTPVTLYTVSGDIQIRTNS